MAGEGVQVFMLLNDMLTEMLTVKQSAYRLKYAERTIRQWCDEGKLIAINVENRWWIPLIEIERHERRDLEASKVAS